MAERKPKKPHSLTTIKNIAGGYLLWCQRCHQTARIMLPSPMPSDHYAKMLMAFLDFHRYCQSGESPGHWVDPDGYPLSAEALRKVADEFSAKLMNQVETQART